MRKLIIYYFLLLFSLLSLFSSGVIDSQDGFQYLAVARNIYYKGEPTAPTYEYDTRKNIHMSVLPPKDGKVYSLTSLGFSLAYLPAVAVTDLVYKLYGVTPQIHFPLENDWLIFLSASFTNSFFGAMVGGVLFLYLLELGLPRKQSIFISVVGLFSTNLLVYAKHSFPHMMFICFLLLSFYLIKKYSKTNNKFLLLLAGMSYGVTAITYSFASVLSGPSLFAYFLLLSKTQINRSSLKKLAVNVLVLFIGFLPLFLIYIWFENLRATPSLNFSNPGTATSAVSWLSKVPVGIFLEGIFGQLFSPGRSIFLYSPILLLPLLFWYKIKKRILPELILALILSASYILLYASVYRAGGLDQGIAALWHGENSWGPRYLTPLIPFGMLIIGFIFTRLKSIEKWLIFYPLLAVGLYMNFLGVILPYQIKLHDLQEKFFLNGTEYKSEYYSNFLPRYSPVLSMSKKLVKLGQNFPKTFDRGIYNVRFYDGFDFTFPVGGERWRTIEGIGYISFDNLKRSEIQNFTLGMINHPIADSSSSAELSFVLNDYPLIEKPIRLEASERNIIKIPVDRKFLKDKKNELLVRVNYRDPSILEEKKQILGLIAFSINNTAVNLESIDVPYVSSLGPVMGNIKYKNWGGENNQSSSSNNDPWKYWDIHTQTYERLPDLWWVRNLFYWDIPKSAILTLLGGIIISSIYAGVKILKP